MKHPGRSLARRDWRGAVMADDLQPLDRPARDRQRDRRRSGALPGTERQGPGLCRSGGQPHETRPVVEEADQVAADVVSAHDQPRLPAPQAREALRRSVRPCRRNCLPRPLKRSCV